MKALFLSQEDWARRGGSNVRVYHNMIAAVKKGGIDAEHRFVTTRDMIFEDIERFEPDIVFSGAYHTYEHDGSMERVHELLDLAEIPYVGSDADALDVVLDKTAAKAAWRNAGIRTADFFSLNSNNRLPQDKFPLLIKPSKEGSSRGITERCVVYDNDNLNDIASKLRSDGFEELFAETYLGHNRREFTVAVVGKGDYKLVSPSEMVYCGATDKPKVITSDMKEGTPGTRIFEPEAVPEGDLKKSIISVASSMYDTVNIRDYGRCDVMMGEDGNLYAIEINGQSVIESYFLTGMRALGLDYDQTINAMFYTSIMRHRKEGKNLDVPAEMDILLPEHICARLDNI